MTARNLEKAAGDQSVNSLGRVARHVCDDVEREREARERARNAEMLARREAQNERLHQQARTDRWAAAVSAALDDVELTDAVRRLTRPIEGLGRRSVPAVRAALLCWASHAAAERPELALHEALTAELGDDPTPERVPERMAQWSAPAVERPAPELSIRLHTLLPRIGRELEPPGRELSL